MFTNQTKIATMGVGIAGFFLSMGTFYASHTVCGATYEALAHLSVVIGSFATAMCAAFRYDIKEK